MKYADTRHCTRGWGKVPMYHPGFVSVNERAASPLFDQSAAETAFDQSAADGADVIQLPALPPRSPLIGI